MDYTKEKIIASVKSLCATYGLNPKTTLVATGCAMIMHGIYFRKADRIEVFIPASLWDMFRWAAKNTSGAYLSSFRGYEYITLDKFPDVNLFSCRYFPEDLEITHDDVDGIEVISLSVMRYILQVFKRPEDMEDYDTLLAIFQYKKSWRISNMEEAIRVLRERGELK